MATSPADVHRVEQNEQNEQNEQKERIFKAMSLCQAEAVQIAKRRREAASVPDHLLCGVCLDAPVGRIEQCPHGHIICAHVPPIAADHSCLFMVYQSARDRNVSPKCPTCRIELADELNRCLVAEQAVGLLPTTCTFCMGDTTRGEVSDHEEGCPSGPELACSAADGGCSWTGTVAARRAHDQHCKLALQRAVWEKKMSLSHELGDSGDNALHSFVIQFAKSRIHGAHLLHAASEFNMRPLLRKLIDARWGQWGVDLDVPCHPGGETAMCVAARHGHSDVLRALIKAGAAINDGYSDAGITPLHLACGGGHTSAVHVLLFAHANVHARRVDNNKTPLHAACHGGNADIVKLLLENGADVNACATQGGVSTNVSPLFEAAERGDAAVINVLVRERGIEYRRLRTSDNSSVIAVARSNGHVQISEQLVMAANWADRVEWAVNEDNEDSADSDNQFADLDAESDAEAISSDDEDEPLGARVM